MTATLKELKSSLREKAWDGVIVGWCLRGNPERTALFEQVISVCVEAMREKPGMKLMFCEGPDYIAEAVLGSFGNDTWVQCL